MPRSAAGSRWGCARGEVCEGDMNTARGGEKSLDPLARRHSAENVDGIRLASPGRGAKKERHRCRRGGTFGLDQEKLWIHFTVNQCFLVKMEQTATKKNQPQSKSC